MLGGKVPGNETKNGNESEAAFRAMIKVYGLIEGSCSRISAGWESAGPSGGRFGFCTVWNRRAGPGCECWNLGTGSWSVLQASPGWSPGFSDWATSNDYYQDGSPRKRSAPHSRRPRAGPAGTPHPRRSGRAADGGLNKAELQQLWRFMDRLSDHLEMVARNEKPVKDSGMIFGGKTGELDVSTVRRFGKAEA